MWKGLRVKLDQIKPKIKGFKYLSQTCPKKTLTLGLRRHESKTGDHFLSPLILVDFILFTPNGVFNVHGGVIIEEFLKNLCALTQTPWVYNLSNLFLINEKFKSKNEIDKVP